VFAALAVSHWIEHQTGWSIKKFVRTARRYRTVQIKAGRQTLTAERGYGDIRFLRHHRRPAHRSDQYAGVEDQPVRGSVSLSVDTAARAAAMFSLKASSIVSIPRQRRSTAFNAAPVAAGPGLIAAIRRPARVTTTFSPFSTESSTAEKFRDASEAVISRMDSDHQILKI